MDSRVTQLLNAWADDVVRLENEVADVRTDNIALRETLSAALQALHEGHVRDRRQREIIANLTAALRAQRPSLDESSSQRPKAA